MMDPRKTFMKRKSLMTKMRVIKRFEKTDIFSWEITLIEAKTVPKLFAF